MIQNSFGERTMDLTVNYHLMIGVTQQTAGSKLLLASAIGLLAGSLLIFLENYWTYQKTENISIISMKRTLFAVNIKSLCSWEHNEIGGERSAAVHKQAAICEH